MPAKKSQKKIKVNDVLITWQQVNDEDYISLTDMANWDGDPNARTRIQSWLKNGNTVKFLELWERFHNPDFNYMQMDVIKLKLLENSYILTAKRWIEATKAIGIQAKAGRYGGTYAHRDIAFEFATWLSPEFKFYLIREFQRLKEEETRALEQGWDYRRFLTKVNYKLHTETIRDHIIPRLQVSPDKKWLVYADEADLLNMAVFGQTARQWREDNPEKARKGNMRDFADIIQLNVLANLESLNAVLIEQGSSKESRFDLLAKTAISQYRRLSAQEEFQQLEDTGKLPE